MVGGGVGADFLVLPDVVVLLAGGRHQGPERALLGLLDVQEPGADRRQQPFVQAGAVVVAIEIGMFEREVGVSVRAVDEDFDAQRPGHRDDFPNRHDLSGQVGDVGDLDHLGSRRDGGAELVDQIFL